MQDSIEPIFADSSGQNNHRINLEKMFSRIWEYWPSILIAVAIAMFCAFIYLRYATPQYLVKAKVLVKNDKKDGANGALLAELGMGNNTSNVENEIEVFKSRVLMQKVVSDMHLNIRCYLPGNIKTADLYDNIPFTIIPFFRDSNIKASYSYDFELTGPGNYRFTSGNTKWDGKYGDTLLLNIGKIVVVKNITASGEYDAVKSYKIIIGSISSFADQYMNALTVDLPNKQVNIVSLSLKDNNAQRAEDILNKLIEVYQSSNLSDMNEVADGTIDFINNRLALVSEELTGVEKEIGGFKSRNKFTDVEAQSRLLITSTGENSKALTEKEVQLKVLESLDKYLQDNNAKRMMPATLLAQDATLTSIIEQYNNLLSQRQKLLLSYTERSPYVQNVNTELQDVRTGMRSYIASLKRGYQVAVNELKTQSGEIDEKITAVPEKERVFMEYSRRQHVKQELYLFLLKKREEMAISKSATASNLKIIDPARQTGAPVSPVKSKAYLIALALGLCVPGVFIAFKEAFNNRINSKADIQDITGIDILGEIAHGTDDSMVAVTKDSRTIIAEQFRTLRTNLQFLLTAGKGKVVMVTSSMSGEGKSFISVNIACAMALSGKKVVLLELDLRKPKIAAQLGITNDVGFSDHIIGQAGIDAILKPSNILKDLFIVTSGILPPNPAELIMLPATETFFKELNQRFDYIVIDTAPVGLVTDAQLLSGYANTILYVVRQGYTYTQQVKAADSLYRSARLQHLSIVLNDVKMNRRGDSGYGTYGSGYYATGKNENSKIQQLIKRKINATNNTNLK